MNASEQQRRDELVNAYREAQRTLGDFYVARRLQSLVRTQLTSQQLRALAILLLDGAISAHELANALGVSPATVSGILDRLEGAGMVERRPDARDGRVRRIVVTDRGRKAIHGIVAEPVDAAIDDPALTTDELEALTLGLHALLRVSGPDVESSADGSAAVRSPRISQLA